MKNILPVFFKSVFLFGFLWMIPTDATAYMGPGAGLGMIGSLIAVAAVILLAIVGIVILPIQMLRKKLKGGASGVDSMNTPNPAPDGGTEDS